MQTQSLLPGGSSESAPRGARRGTLFGVVFLAAAVLLVHGWSLGDGTVLDDYWHQRAMREHGWSLSELMRSVRIDTHDLADVWWQEKPVRWDYPRPLFILAMKTVYEASGRDPVGLHALSISLDFLTALMVWRLAWLLTRQRGWSLLAGLLFVAYPHSVISVAWPSAQNTVLINALMLACLLLYLRASGLKVGPQSARDGDPPTPMRRGGFALLFLVWAASLFVRENALTLPVLIVAFDFAFGGVRQVRARMGYYVLFALVGGAFLAWRAVAFGGAMPDVYLRLPDGDIAAYVAWCAAKLLHYICASIWLAPMVVGPTGRFNPWTEATGDCVLMLAIVAVLAATYFTLAKHVRGWWIWPLWIVLAVLPVVPVIATPHSGNLCAIPFAIAVVLGAGTARFGRSRAIGRWGRATAWFYVAGVVLFAVFSRAQWTGIIGAERIATARISAAPPARDVSDVFVMNFPFVNVYNRLGLVAELGPWFDKVRYHVLTYAPDPVLIEQRITLEQVDEHSFTLAIEGQPWFSRLLGRFLIDAYRTSGRLTEGQVVRHEQFDVRVLEADDQGVRKLKFTFRKPLSDPAYCFYLATEHCAAARIRFSSPPVSAVAPIMRPDEIDSAAARLDDGDAQAGARLLRAALSDKPELARRAASAVRPVADLIARAYGAPVMGLLERDTLTAADWERVRAWWRSSVSDASLEELWIARNDYDRYIEMREEVPHARMWIGMLIHTDLYLTGPPFPGPR